MSQVNDLLEKQLVEEAVLLAETIAAVEASKSSTAADEVSKAGKVLHSINNMYVHVHVQFCMH